MLKRLGIKKDELLNRELVQSDVQQILAYLEELGRLRTLVHLHIRSEPALCLGARIELVNDQDFTFSLSFPHQVPRLKAGEVVEMHFPLTGMRFKADIAFHDRGRYMESVFKLPRSIQFADRREARRTRIGSREKASAAVFESLFEGVAASGRLLNISMEGLCIRMERAIQVQGGKRLASHQDLFTVGQELQIVRILNLPQLPTIECSGEVRFCGAISPGGPILLGIKLEALGSFDSANLHRFMMRRLPTYGRAFPTKRRRGAVEEDPEEEQEEELQEEGAAAADGTEELLEDPFAALVDAPVVEAPDDSGKPSEDRLLRLRRRGKRFLVIIPDDLDRSIFVCTLHVGGYTSFYEARNLVHGLEMSKKVKLDAIFLDQQIGPLSGVEVAQRLRKMGRLEGVPIFGLMRSPDVRTLLSAKAAGVNHVVEVPVDFDGKLKELLDRTLRLTKQ
jgi:CheY-like chemotaxis protein